MTSTLGGDDPLHGLDGGEIDKEERQLRKKAREKSKQPKERNRLIKRVVQVVSTPSLREKYKRLLKSDWKKSTLDAVLELLWKEIEASERPAKIPLLEVLDPDRTGISTPELNADVIEEIRHFRRHFSLKATGVYSLLRLILPKK